MPFESAQQPQHPVEELRKLFREAGLSLTHQRVVIYGELLNLRSHPSPEAIYERVREQIPSISLGTVYKNIRAFLDSGLIREVSPHHGTLRLETNLDDHHHLVCTRCKTIVDLEDADLDPVRLRRKLPEGFHLERYKIELHGLCAACAKQSK